MWFFSSPFPSLFSLVLGIRRADFLFTDVPPHYPRNGRVGSTRADEVYGGGTRAGETGYG